MPANLLHLEDNINNVNQVTESDFNDVLDEVEDFYFPVVARHGARFSVNRKWNDSTVNAYANQSNGTYFITMFGGLARRNEITKDGFQVVACHEVGHHLGGAPKYPGQWASNEGNSDYYATHACLKALWQDDFVFGNPDPTQDKDPEPTGDLATDLCNSAWDAYLDRAICIRSVKAGISTATLLSALGNQGVPKIETPDSTRVSRTSDTHPKGQCRLDTMLAGALCTQQWDIDVIPVKSELAEYTCMRSEGYTLQARPECWYRE
jgi:hypothetical protein